MAIPHIELDAELAAQALQEACGRFPQFAEFGAQLVGRPIYQGVAYQLTWATNPPAELTGGWEFQNAAVKAYQRLLAARSG